MKAFHYHKLTANSHFAKASTSAKESIKDLTILGGSVYAAPLVYSSIATATIQTNAAIQISKYLTGSTHMLAPVGGIVNKFAHSLIDHPVSWLTGITASKFAAVKIADNARNDSNGLNLSESIFSPVINPCATVYHNAMGGYKTLKAYQYKNHSDENYGFDINVNNLFIDQLAKDNQNNNTEKLKLERISFQETEAIDGSTVLINMLTSKYSVTLGIIADDKDYINVNCTGCDESTSDCFGEIG